MTIGGQGQGRRVGRGGERSALWRAAAALVLLALVTAVAIHPSLPFRSGYQIRAVFSTALQLQPGNPVRIAGVPVGQVSGVGAGPHGTAIVTMQIDNSGRPVHSDATADIQPRLILEGNYYVDLHPGTPESPELANGATISRAHTAVPVQLDQVLDTFNAPTRGALNSFTQQMAAGLGPTSDLAQSGAGGLRDADRQLDAALHDITVASAAFQGTQPGDLTHTVRSFGDFTAQLAQNPASLAGLMTNMNRTAGALAANDQALAAGVSQMDGALGAAPPALRALDRNLPAVRSFAVALTPALAPAPPALRATGALLTQSAALASRPELPSLVAALTPVTDALPGLEQRLGGLFRYVTPVNTCVSTHVVPVADAKLNDGPLSTGRPVWQDFVHSWVGGANGSPNFDANGKNIRIQIAAGDNLIESFIPGIGQVATGVGTNIEGTDPIWLGTNVVPPKRPDAPCADQPLPDLGARRATGVPKGFTESPAPPPVQAPGPSLASLIAKYGDPGSERRH